MDFLVGKKTFIVAILTVVFAVSGYFTGHVSFNEMVQLLSIAGVGTGLKLGQLGK